MNYNNIPDKMKEYPHWIVWKLEDRDGKKPTKVPYCAHGGHASVSDSGTWTTFNDAIQALQCGIYNGIGFVFTSTPFIGIDIDGCADKDTGEVTKEALDALETLKSYTEVSQSGSGFHIVLEGQLPPGRRRNGAFEMYGEGSPRYFAMTGNLWGEYGEIREDQRAINTIHQKYIEPPTIAMQTATKMYPVSSVPSTLSDQELIERARTAKNGSKFISLWSGDISSYDNDHSLADLALCGILAFWCQCDPVSIDRLFRQSGLMRPKWDEKRGQDTYGNNTIKEAIAGCADTYVGSKTQKGNTCPLSQVSEEWENPIPFQTVQTPNFPTDCLPAPMASFVKALAESTQTPEELGGILSLGILATAFQSRHDVGITTDYTEPLCLYTVAIASPGERKSAVISALSRPVYDYEIMRQESEAVEVAKNKTERNLLEKTLHNLKNQEAKKPGTCREEVLDLSAQLAEFEDKFPFRLLVDDTTPEKLTDIMNTQGGCITVSSAEGGVFDAMEGRYSNSTNIDVYLKGHAGDMMTVDRMGRDGITMKRPRLSMILTIQPNVLNGFMENSTFKGRGLCGRFLYAVCKSKVGYRDVDPEPIPLQVRERYYAFIQRILSGEDTGVILLSAEAHKMRLAYAERVEKLFRDEWEHMRDWGGKLVGAMLRIAALIHAAEVQGNPTETPISPEVVTAAVEIAEYLGVHAMAAYQVMGADKNYANAKCLLDKLKRIEPGEISKSSLFDMCKGKVGLETVKAMEPALQLLVDMHYIKVSEQRTGGKGRPSQKINVNPTIKNSKNSEIEG